MMESMSNGRVPGGRRHGGLDGLLLDGGVEGGEQVCTDPKSCPQPGSMAPAALFDADEQVCTDPKSCPQPQPSVHSVPH